MKITTNTIKSLCFTHNAEKQVLIDFSDEKRYFNLKDLILEFMILILIHIIF